eukprot:363979-Chlamydomonas_euryale.AAC.4
MSVVCPHAHAHLSCVGKSARLWAAGLRTLVCLRPFQAPLLPGGHGHSYVCAPSRPLCSQAVTDTRAPTERGHSCVSAPCAAPAREAPPRPTSSPPGGTGQGLKSSQAKPFLFCCVPYRPAPHGAHADVEFIVGTADQPAIRLDRLENGALPYPLLRFCKSETHADVLVPDIHFQVPDEEEVVGF